MMKKWILLAAAISVVIGCGIVGISMNALGWDFKRLDTENGDWKEERFDVSEIEKILVSGASVPILVEASKDESVHVFAYITETVSVSTEQREDVLYIGAEEALTSVHSFRMFRGLKSMYNGIVVRIPSGYRGETEIENNNGSVTVSELRSFGNLSVTNKNGRISLEDVSVCSAAAENSNGSIHLEDVTASEGIKTKNSNGSISIEEATAKTAEFLNGNGRIVLEEVSAAESLNVQNSNGSIRIEEIFSPEILLTNRTGSIRGEIDGRKTDYRVVSNTKNGFSNLTNNADLDRPYLLEVKNDNGSTRITFSKE